MRVHKWRYIEDEVKEVAASHTHSLSLSIYLSFYSFGHRLSSILSARFFLVTKLLSPLCSTEQWKGEREKEREREVHEPLCSTELPNSLCR